LLDERLLFFGGAAVARAAVLQEGSVMTEAAAKAPQQADIPKVYDPRDVEAKWYKFWEEQGFFHVEPDEPGEVVAVVIPPPHVSGSLHMGHALNVTLQDVLVRWRRMQGKLTLWVPG